MGMSVRLVPATVFNTAVPMINRELGSIPRRSRHLKKSVNVNILTFTDDKIKYYEQIPVQFNALESTQSLPIWSRFGFIFYHWNSLVVY